MEKSVGIIQQRQQPNPLPLERPHASFLEGNWSIRYHPESVESFVTQWVESTSGLESYRERHCKSDTFLSHSDDDPIPRRLTKSAPNLDDRWDADGCVLPPTLASRRSRLYQASIEDNLATPSYTPSDTSRTSTGSSRKKLVEDPLYRRTNLAENKIYLRSRREQFPKDIRSLVDHVARDRDSPGPSEDEVWQDEDLEALGMGASEGDVQTYLQAEIFPRSAGTLQRSVRLAMAKRAVPDVGSRLKVSLPVPDVLYGYNSIKTFPQHQDHLRSMGNEMVANVQDLVYPFFVIEFQADSPGESGSIWVATNQCLGGSATCVNIAERLNNQLEQYYNIKEVRQIDSSVFSIAMNGTEARLYISWRHNGLDYYTRIVDSFSLQKPRDYVEFRKYVRNIIDWGKDRRLNEIRDSSNGLGQRHR